MDEQTEDDDDGAYLLDKSTYDLLHKIAVHMSEAPETVDQPTIRLFGHMIGTVLERLEYLEAFMGGEDGALH